MRPRSNARHLHLRALTIAVLAALPVLSGANPLDPTVVTGNATFQQAGSTLTVTNTPGSVIQWQSFSIGQNELTRFVQQSSASQVLNRVVGADPSQILGTLQSNGQVFLINPNGIAFGPNARVDVAGLVASSLNISNADFAAGRLNFSATLEAGAIRNDGRITALSGGNIYLIAPTVENHGVIQAADGAVVLAAGKSATLVDTHRPDVQVQISAPDNEAVNVGQIVGGHIGIYAGAIRNEGSLSASQAVQNTDGSITLRSASSVITSGSSTVETAGGRIDIDAGSVYHAGRIDASGHQGGQITVRTTNGFVQSGSIAADGTAGVGGRVTIESSGSIAQTVSAATSATGTTGGTIVLSSGAQSRTFLSGSVDASSATGSGGTIHVLGGDIALAGATLSASGSTAGGTILVGGDTRGTNPSIANANSVYATSTTTIRADAMTSGHGGKVVLWSDGTTRSGATLSARGGSVSGDGGFIEVSGKDSTSFGGIASAAAPHGQAGTFLLDPRNAIIDDVTNGISYRDLLDPNPNTDSTSGNGWGQTIELYSGNTLVTDPYDNAMGVKSGAIYLYRGDDGALLTALTGAAAQDSVGIGHRQTLSGGNLLLVHTLFGSGDGVIDHAKGAVTWLNPNTGLLSDGTSGGAVGISNSLVGSTSGDRILLTVNNGLATPLAGSGGGYFLLSEAWNGSRGAITWINAATGALGNGATGGTVSATNSLVGENAGDRVGYGRYEGYPYYTYRPVVQTLGSGLLFFSAYYGSGGTLANGKGAVTWLNTSNGRFADGTYGGVLSSANSIVGGTAGDRVGVTNSGEASLLSMSGNALLLSPNFASATGALTWINGTTGRLSDGSMGAVVSASNSFVGSSAGDGVGSISGTSVTGGYMFRMPEWNSARGAMMWINMATGATPSGAINGVVGASNSIVGGTAGDRFGSNVQTLSSNHFLVLSPDWDDTAQGLQDVGAVTWINRNGTLVNGALAGTLSSATSLIGGAALDRVGSGGVQHISGSAGALVLSPVWGGGGVDANAKGAVTWINVSTGATLAGSAGGVLSAANSLVGNSGDRIGTVLGAGAGNGGGVYLAGSSSPRSVFIASPNWDNGTGAVTFVSSTGRTADGALAIGAVSEFNSVVGHAPGSHVGEFVHVLSNGHVVLRSPDFTVGTGDLIDILGAVTWVNGTNGLLAGMSSSTQFGVEGSSRVSGSNSLVGANDGDRVGSGGLYNNGSTLLVLSPSVTVDAGNFTVTGAVTWMDRNSGRLSNMTSASLFPQIGGTVSAANSLLGLDVANLAITAVSGSNVLMLDKTWSAGRGALTWLSGAGLLANQATGGIVSESTSIVGSSDGEGATMSLQAVGSNYVLLTPDWSGFGDIAQAGAVTWINTSTGRLSDGNSSGFIDQGNSIVGSNAGDRIGSGGLTQLPYYYGSHLYFIHSPEWSDNGSTPGAGALTWFNSSTGLLAGMTSAADFGELGGAVSAANSLVGAHAGDRIGEGTELTRTEYYYGSSWKLLIRHASYGEGAGAITWMQGTNGSIAGGDFGGVVSSGNSLLGSASGDALGSGGIQRVSNQDTGQFFVLTPDWSDEGSKTGAGAVTWIDGLTGHLSDGSSGGVVSSANSLVGSASGDAIGSGGVQRASDDYYEMLHLVLSPNWSDGGTKSAAGAVTWIDGSTGALIDDSTGGVVGASNSLVGGVAGDAIGSGGLHHLSVGGSRGLILSPSWSDGGTKANAGAITWYNAQTKLLANGEQMRGVISGSNSLVGSGAGDNVGGRDYYGFGSYRFRDLNGTWALVFSPEWSDGGTKVNAGAVTWLNMENGLLANMATEVDFGEFGGAISAANSLLGAHAGDRIGGNSYDYYYGAYFYSNIEYARNGAVFLLSPAYNSQAGAVTWLDGNNARLSNGNVGGTIGVANSLVGDRAGDQVGSDLIGTYEVMAFVRSTEWHNRTGAVTPIDPMTGRLIDGSTGGVVSSGNSLVGSNAGDRVGYSYTSVYGGDGYNYLFHTPHWNNGRGAATWMSAHGLLSNMTSATGYNGTVSAANSLIGSLPEVVEESYGDAISGTRVFTVYDQNDDQHFVVMSGNWNDGRGAITRIRGDNGLLMDGATGGVVTAANSLVGSSAGDGIGAQAYPQGVGSGNSLIVSTTFGNGRGSVTLMPEDWSLVGTVNADNSVIGSRPNSGLQTNNYYYSSFLQDSANGNSLIRFSTDGTGRIVVLANDFANDANPPVHFANGIGTDIAISPTIIENMLNAGTHVLIQANNDIIVRKAINATGTTTSNGALRFQAGRSILVNADVTNLNMDDGGMSIWMTAHESAANGVVASDRDSGAGEIRMALGTSITGGGTVRLEIGSGAGVGSAGGIYVANVSGALVEIINAVSQSVDANRIIEQLINSTVRQTGPLGGGTNGVVMQASGAIVSAPTSLVQTQNGGVSLSGSSVGAPAAPMRLAAAGTVSVASTTGGAFLEQPQGSAGSGAYAVTVADAQPLVINIPNGVLTISQAIDRAGAITLTGGQGLQISTVVSSNSNVSLNAGSGGIVLNGASVDSSGGTVSFAGPSLSITNSTVLAASGLNIGVSGPVTITDSNVRSSSTLSVSTSSLAVASLGSNTVLGGNGGTSLNVSGNVSITGSSEPESSGGSARIGTAGLCTGTINGDLIITGGSASGASAQLFGSPDIGSAGSPLRIGGEIIMTTGSGSGAFARVAADLPTTIYLDFFNAASGGYTVNGDPSVSSGISGFYAGGASAVLGENLIITYGGRKRAVPAFVLPPAPTPTQWPAGPVAIANDVFDERTSGLPQCR